MSETINFADLIDFSGTDAIAPKNNVYALLLRKTGPASKSVYKFNLDLLENFFLAEEELNLVKRRVINLRKSLETITQGFETMEYLSKNKYMLKYDADSFRKMLATEESAKAMTTDYMTKDRLDAQLKEAERHAYECAASFATSMSYTAATARSANARNNTSVAKFDELTEAIGNIKLETNSGSSGG